MFRYSIRLTWRSRASASWLALGLIFAGLVAPAGAEEILDPVGDFLSTYTGPHDPGLDAVAHEVTLAGDHMIFYGRMAGAVAPTEALGGLYLFGVDRGQGTPRFVSGTPPIGPNVLWDLIVRVNPNGTGLVNNVIAGIVTQLNPDNILVNGNEFIVCVPLSLLSPSAERPPCEWTYNLWPRNGLIRGQNGNVSDLAPDDGNSPVQTVPELACIADLATLWPADHRMVEVAVFIKATDECTDPKDLLLEVLVTSDEPDDAEGDGDGHTIGDTDGKDGFTAPVDVSEFFTFDVDMGCFVGFVCLRAERDGSGSGRTYKIEATVTNSDNNRATSSFDVVVPHHPTL